MLVRFACMLMRFHLGRMVLSNVEYLVIWRSTQIRHDLIAPQLSISRNDLDGATSLVTHESLSISIGWSLETLLSLTASSLCRHIVSLITFPHVTFVLEWQWGKCLMEGMWEIKSSRHGTQENTH